MKVALWETKTLRCGNRGGGLFRAPSTDFLAIDASKYFVLKLCPSGPTTSHVIDPHNDMSCMLLSPGSIVTPWQIIGRGTN